MKKNTRKAAKKIIAGAGVIFLVSIFTISVSETAEAATPGCTWRISTQVSGSMYSPGSYTGGCLKGETASKNNDDCDINTKPEATISPLGTVHTTPQCCCIQQIPEVSAKFIMPDMQIPIPTVQLTASGALNVVTDANGSTRVSIPWISEYIIGIYNYGLSIAGILAAIMLMAGGVIWLISGGDASKISQAKELIAGSVVGLVILASSYILLTQINPELVESRSLSLGAVDSQAPDIEPISSDGNINNSTACSDCTVLTIPVKNGNQANSAISKKLETAYNNSSGLAWRVTEAYPPSSQHNSTCHSNGMCADVALTVDRSCVAVNKLIKILEAAGLSVFNEYTGCGGTATTHTTGGHLHVR